MITLKNKFYYIFTYLALFVVALVITFYGSRYFNSTDQIYVDIPKDLTSFEKAEFYFSAANYDLVKARSFYEAAIRENPRGNSLQWYQLARINFIQGEFDTSLHNLGMQVWYFGDTIHNVHYMYGLVYGFRADMLNREKDFDLAAEHFLRFLEYDKYNPWARIDLAWIYFSQRNFEQMVNALVPVYEQEQDNPWLLNMYGLALLNTGESKRAVDYLTKAAELSLDLVPADWAAVYPGNDPKDYQAGLDEFIVALNLNLAVAQGRVEKDGNN